jgi:hypothetical protein
MSPTEEDITLAFLLQAPDSEIEEYQSYLSTCHSLTQLLRSVNTSFAELPPAILANPYWSASNRAEWVLLKKYAIFLLESGDEERKNASVGLLLSVQGHSWSSDSRFTRQFAIVQKETVDKPSQALKRRSPSDVPDVIEISDDDSDSATLKPPPLKKRVQHAKIKSEPTVEPLPPTPIVTDPPTPISTTVPVTIKRTADGRICITQRESVQRIVELDDLPDRFEVDEVDTAYVINMSRTSSSAAKTETSTGRPKGLDVLLKAGASRSHCFSSFPSFSQANPVGSGLVGPWYQLQHHPW